MREGREGVSWARVCDVDWTLHGTKENRASDAHLLLVLVSPGDCSIRRGLALTLE